MNSQRSATALGVSWFVDAGRLIAGLVALLVAMALAVPSAGASEPPEQVVPVIVEAAAGQVEAARLAVTTAGGTVGQTFATIDGFAAHLPAGAAARLETRAEIAAITPDSPVLLNVWDDEWTASDLRSLQKAADGAVAAAEKDLAKAEKKLAKAERDLDKATDKGKRKAKEAAEDALDAAKDARDGASEALDAARDAAEDVKKKAPATLDHVTKVTGARHYWSKGYTGAGVDVAVIDSGLVPVPGLDSPAKVVDGLDVSFESQADPLRHLDTYGHGTHLAGIIAGRDGGSDRPKDYSKAKPDRFLGMAPDARILNVKVATADGSVDVSQVIAAIDWVVQHRNDNGLNVRVLNLSFGTTSDQSYLYDPLAHAVDVAWQAGIVVVVAAGNDGNSGDTMTNPATNPRIIAVGALDTKGTTKDGDDEVPAFSSCSQQTRTVDLVAPGRSIASLRAPGSYADVNYPDARHGSRLMLGSGTSQAAAIVSGAAALVLDQHPDYSPDQVKALLMTSAKPVGGAERRCEGAGSLDLKSALKGKQRTTVLPRAAAPTLGTGSLEAARGDLHLSHDGVALQGEIDIFGNPWNGAAWAPAAANGTSWSGGEWNGASWSGASWSGASWSGASWSSISWSGASWSGASWSGASWSGASWSGASWSGASWSGLLW